MDITVKQKFDTYPEHISVILHQLRDLIFQVAQECDITNIQETLKWGEPSYLSSIGSTVRFDWKDKNPEQYCLYFNCKSTLIEAFKELYHGVLTFEGNRAIVLNINDKMPTKALSHCISLALRYKKIKHLPLLGA